MNKTFTLGRHEITVKVNWLSLKKRSLNSAIVINKNKTIEVCGFIRAGEIQALIEKSGFMKAWEKRRELCLLSLVITQFINESGRDSAPTLLEFFGYYGGYEEKIPTLTSVITDFNIKDKEVKKAIKGDSISILWRCSSVVERATELGILLTGDQAKIILALVDREYSADKGVTWDTIDNYLACLKRSYAHG